MHSTPFFGVPCTLKLVCHARHLVCYAHHTGVPCTPHWCAMHTIFGVHDTLVNCFIPPIPLYKHVIHNRIHKFCSIYCLSSIHTNDDSNQGYQYVFLKHITVLVTTTHKIILRTLNALSLQILSTDGCYSSLSICIPETYNSTCYNSQNHITYFKCLITTDTFH